MKASELRDLSNEELDAKASDLRGELFNVKVKRSTGQLESTALAKQLRRDIARVETVLREKRGASQ
ncbi:MAG: 50S ribosomal protein L29 [Deltaproteobacteria bacterium]|nr:50S ribosomal protein L29 [Deltaproteobacteria bacterium]MBW2360503.1 50S ribosomal protein L29 [Deltaproteobacteria bacterium]